MKRFLWMGSLLMFLAWLAIASCSNPLETETPDSGGNPAPPIDTVFVGDSICDTLRLCEDTVTLFDTLFDTLLQVDTVFTGDSVCDTLIIRDCLDTVHVVDSIFIRQCQDTLFVTDSVIVKDTVRLVDTVQVLDTISVTDTVMFSDTVVVTDTVRVPDSIVYRDTLVVTDTVTVTDSVVVSDTVTVTDSIFVTDTLHVNDTIVVTDTVVVEIPDTSACSNSFCSNLSSHQQNIVWLLDNNAGRYRLEFTGEAERDKPLQEVTITVDNRQYKWSPATDATFNIDLHLGDDAKVELSVDKPPAYGHALSVCLKVVEL